MAVKITLDYNDFKTLISGGVVTKTSKYAHLSEFTKKNSEVQIILQDIGFTQMHDALYIAQYGKKDENSNNTGRDR